MQTIDEELHGEATYPCAASGRSERVPGDQSVPVDGSGSDDTDADLLGKRLEVAGNEDSISPTRRREQKGKQPVRD